MNRRNFFGALGSGLAAGAVAFVPEPKQEGEQERKRRLRRKTLVMISPPCNVDDAERIALARDGDIIRVACPDQIRFVETY